MELELGEMEQRGVVLVSVAGKNKVATLFKSDELLFVVFGS